MIVGLLVLLLVLTWIWAPRRYVLTPTTLVVWRLGPKVRIGWDQIESVELLEGRSGLGVPDYFDEMLERIRDIRASERRMYLRVREIFARAADYEPSSEQDTMKVLEDAAKNLPDRAQSHDEKSGTEP